MSACRPKVVSFFCVSNRVSALVTVDARSCKNVVHDPREHFRERATHGHRTFFVIIARFFLFVCVENVRMQVAVGAHSSEQFWTQLAVTARCCLRLQNVCSFEAVFVC